jgi:S-adenosylmethionine:tRNA ribosyltransferase-isomerase
MTALSAPHTWFQRPDELTADAPPEDRGLPRDGVRLLVASPDGIAHARFADLADHLQPGDLVVVNTSATVAAEVDAVTVSGSERVLHLAAPLAPLDWVVEVRTAPDAARAVLNHRPGDVLRLRNGTTVTLTAPFAGSPASPTGDGNRLWVAEVSDPEGLQSQLERSGRPIAYGYLRRPLPLSDYQTVFARHPGSAEMPSAGRPFARDRPRPRHQRCRRSAGAAPHRGLVTRSRRAAAA